MESSALLSDQSLILVMRTDPDPDKVRTLLHCEGAVIEADPHGPQLFPTFLKCSEGWDGFSFRSSKFCRATL